MGRGGCPGCPRPLFPGRVGVPFTPQRPPPRPQLPCRSLLPPGAPARLCPASGRTEVRREERARRGGTRPGAGEGGAREPARERTLGPRRGLTMARGEARTRGRRPRVPQPPPTGQPCPAGPLPHGAMPGGGGRGGASYLGGGGGRAPGCGLRRSGAAGGPSREGSRPGGRGPGREAHGVRAPWHAARRPATAPPHLQLRQGKVAAAAGPVGMS